MQARILLLSLALLSTSVQAYDCVQAEQGTVCDDYAPGYPACDQTGMDLVSYSELNCLLCVRRLWSCPANDLTAFVRTGNTWRFRMGISGALWPPMYL
jgi:hypothetical protein